MVGLSKMKDKHLPQSLGFFSKETSRQEAETIGSLRENHGCLLDRLETKLIKTQIFLGNHILNTFTSYLGTLLLMKLLSMVQVIGIRMLHLCDLINSGFLYQLYYRKQHTFKDISFQVYT